MSNLGGFQVMVVAAKKIGDVVVKVFPRLPKNIVGPLGLLIGVAGGGYIGIRGVEAGIKKITKIAKEKKASKGETFEVTAYGHDKDNDLEFHEGSKFKVLNIIDGNVVLIEKLDDDNNPYVISSEFLKTVSESFAKTFNEPQ